MAFCALTVDQHKALYKLIYKKVLEGGTFDLKGFTSDIYNTVYKASNKHDLALTYSSYVPSYVASLQSEDKDFRSILRNSKADANEIVDKIDEFENNLDAVQSYIGAAPVSNETQAGPSTPSKEAVEAGKDFINTDLQRAQDKAGIQKIMEDLFNLPESQAYAVASIYDRVAQSYAARTGGTPQDFYNTLAFTNSANLPANVKFQSVKELASKNLDQNSLNTLRSSLRAKFGESDYTLEVLDSVSEGLKNENLSLEDNINDFVENGITLNDIANLLYKDEKFDTKAEALSYLINVGDKLSIPKNLLYQIVGEKAVENLGGSYQRDLERAKSLEESGLDPYRIFLETGFERGVDGQWRSDIDTSEMKLIYKTKDLFDNLESLAPSSSGYTLGDIIKYPELFKAYPQLKDILVTASKEGDPGQELASLVTDRYEGEDKNILFSYIYVNRERIKDDPDVFKSLLFHEIQHAIQLIEGFPSYSGTTFDEYYNSAAEVEARNVQLRAEISEEEKSITPISETESVYRSKQVGITNSFDTTKHNFLFQKNRVARAAVQIGEDGKAIIYALTNPNVSSPVHELAHIWEHYITPEEREKILEWTGQEAWDRNTSEQFAKGFEQYLAEGDASNFDLQVIFSRFKRWLTDIYKGIFGSEIDIQLNDPMRKIYSDMLGTDFKERTAEELAAERDTRANYQKLADEYNLKDKLADDFTQPIPANSPSYWKHLSTIQKAFIQKKYDDLIRDGKLTEEQLRAIVNSTIKVEYENSGLSQDLVDQAMFRVGHPELIEDKQFWQSFPAFDSQEYDFYTRAIREAISTGALLYAINNDIVSPDNAKRILLHSGQIGIKEERAIKEKLAEREQQVEQTINPESIKPSERLMDTIKKLASDINRKSLPAGETKGVGNIYAYSLSQVGSEEEFLDAMRQIAEQANDHLSREGMIRSVGQVIVDSATELFPNALVASPDTMLNFEDLNEGLSKSEEDSIPVSDIEQPIEIGDTVSYKGQELTVEEISYGETPADNMYYLSDGSAKFGEFISRVRSLSEQEELVFNNTAPLVFSEIEDELTEEVTDQKAMDYVGLKTVLERLNAKFNNSIKYKVVSEEGSWKGRFKNGQVLINLKNFDITTPFHEYLHPFIEVLKSDNRELYINLANELASSEEGKAIIDELKNSEFYKNGTAEEIGDEALVRYISKKAAENITSEGRRKESKYKNALDRLLDKFRAWFSKLWSNGNMTIKDLKTIPLDASLQDVADLISIHDAVIDLGDRLQLLSEIDKFQEETTQNSYESTLLKKIKSKLDVLENTAKERIASDELLGEVIKLRRILKNPDEVLSMSGYMEQGFIALDRANRSFKEISRKVFAAKDQLSKEDMLEMSRQLEVIKNLVAFYKEAGDYFRYQVDEVSDEDYNVYRKVLTQNENILNNMQNVSADIITNWLYPQVERMNEKIKEKHPDKVISRDQFRNSLRYANSDIDTMFFLLGSVSSSKDVFSATLRNALYSMVEENHLYEEGVLRDIKLGYKDFLESKGIKNSRKETSDYFKENYLRKATIRYVKGYDEEKNPIYDWAEHWAFHEEYHYDLFDRDRTEFMESIQFDDTNQDHINKLLEWEKQNSTTVQIGTNKDKQFIYDENNTKIGEKFVDVPVTKLVPNSKYLNVNFAALKSDPFFNLLYDKYREGNEKLGDGKLQYGIVPQVSKGKNDFADYKAKTIGGGLLSFGGKIVKAAGDFVAPLSEEDTNDRVLENVDGSKFYSVKGSHNILLNESDLDLTLPETVAKYAGNANLTSLKNELNPMAKLAKSLLEDNPTLKQEARKLNKTTSDGRTVFDKIFKRPASVEKERGLLNKQLVEFVNDVMYGESSIETSVNVLGRPISLNKLGKNAAFLTALNNMAFNVTGMIGNWTIGNTMSFIESTGGRYFTKADWAKAEGVYVANMATFLSDPFKLTKSKITQLGIKYDAIQGEFRDKFGKRFVGNIAEKYATKDTLFIFNHGAEHQIQLTALIAQLYNTKVKTKDGSEMSLFDAHSVDEKGHLVLRDDIQWTSQDELDFTNRTHAINKRLNGNYSTFDKTVAQRRWYGQLALMYRKFIYTSIRTRFTKEYVDYELGNVDFGYQRKFFAKLVSDVKEYKFEAAKRLFTREGWNEDEKYAYNKTITELAFLGAVTILGFVIAGAESDDDDGGEWFKKTAELLTLRYRNDLMMFTLFGVGDIVKILKNPSAAMVTLTKYIDFLVQLFDPTDTYSRKTGPFEAGTLKLKAKLLKALPIVRQAISLLSPEDQLAYYRVLKKGD